MIRHILIYVFSALCCAGLGMPPTSAEPGLADDADMGGGGDTSGRPTLQIGPDRVDPRTIPRREQNRLAYRGSIYRTDADLDTDLNIQEWIVGMLSTFDFVPDQRTIHYAWCDRPNITVVGWSGKLVDIQPTRDGLLVELRITPRIEMSPWAGGTMTMDTFHEFYLIDILMPPHDLGGYTPEASRPETLLHF